MFIEDTSFHKYFVNPPSGKFDPLLVKYCETFPRTLSMEENKKRSDEFYDCDNVTDEWKQIMKESVALSGEEYIEHTAEDRAKAEELLKAIEKQMKEAAK